MSALPKPISDAIASVPAGRYAVAVSGGADSVALLHLLCTRPDLHLVVAHLDHETRAGESTLDAQFVQRLAGELKLPCVAHRRSELESGELPDNLQARYRAVRLKLYRRAIHLHGLDAVIQAHHADDQSETVFMRLLRGSGIEGLAGMSPQRFVYGVLILRPLLGVRRTVLRSYLLSRGLAWREDASNAQLTYQRNRVRALLARHEHLVQPLLDVQGAFASLAAELDAHSPSPDGPLPVAALARQHPLVQLHVLRLFSLQHGARPDDLTVPLLERLRNLVEDAAAGPSVCLPGGTEIRRRSRELIALPAKPRTPSV